MRHLLVACLTFVTACGNVNPTAPPGDPDAAAGPDAGGAAADAAGEPIDATTPDAPPAVSCTPNAFVACDDGETLRSCNATGDGEVTTACGAPGCNAGAGRCNACVPDAVACDGAVVERCGPDGLALPDETCALTCVDGGAPHCAYLSPLYLPDVCDALATDPTFDVGTATTLDTGLDAACTGGVVTQGGGPPICVVRAGTITISTAASLTVTGGRALALVADGDLRIAGTLDLSATNTTPGPGGGLRVSGGKANIDLGGGGAGYAQAGAAGGTTVDGGGAAGGGVFDPFAITSLTGGAHPVNPTVVIGVFGGGGGGAATLISCRGRVAVSGTIDAGGGGGGAGFDELFGAGYSIYGGGGGGSGGTVVLQGLAVTVTGRLYANGGGGGGGGGNDDAVGFKGADGTRSSTAAASGGSGATGAGGGGTGGIGAQVPGAGRHRTASAASGGGGGGSVGVFNVVVPAGVAPIEAATDMSPLFSPDRTAPTR